MHFAVEQQLAEDIAILQVEICLLLVEDVLILLLIILQSLVEDIIIESVVPSLVLNHQR